MTPPPPVAPVGTLVPETVSNSSGIIALEQIGRLALLGDLLPSGVLVPPAVVGEVSRTVPHLPRWFAVVSPAGPVDSRVAAADLGPGETEAITLAAERGARVVLDDRAARQLAARLGLRVIGTAGLLLQAKEAGLIPALRPVLDELAAVDFRLSHALRNLALRTAGE